MLKLDIARDIATLFPGTSALLVAFTEAGSNRDLSDNDPSTLSLKAVRLVNEGMCAGGEAKLTFAVSYARFERLYVFAGMQGNFDPLKNVNCLEWHLGSLPEVNWDNAIEGRCRKPGWYGVGRYAIFKQSVQYFTPFDSDASVENLLSHSRCV
jgi:hypothetical protein